MWGLLTKFMLFTFLLFSYLPFSLLCYLYLHVELEVMGGMLMHVKRQGWWVDLIDLEIYFDYDYLCCIYNL